MSIFVDSTDSTMSLVSIDVLVTHKGEPLKVVGFDGSQKGFPSLILVHDLGEDQERVQEFAVRLYQLGYGVFWYPQRGFLPSHKAHQGVALEELASDLLQVVAAIRHRSGGSNPFVCGHGLGSLVAVWFSKAFSRFVSGYILISPLLELRKKIKPIHRMIILSLAEVMPQFRLPSYLTPRFTLPMPHSGTKRVGLPKMSAALVADLFIALGQVKKLLHRMNRPTLIIAAQHDPLYRVEQLRKAVGKQTENFDCTLSFIDSISHQLISEDRIVMDEVSRRIHEWVQDKSQSLPKT